METASFEDGWQRLLDGRLDNMRDDVVRWPLGEVIEFYGEAFVASKVLAERVLVAVTNAGQAWVVQATASGLTVPSWGSHVGLEAAFRDAVAAALVGPESARASRTKFPRGAYAHEEGCVASPCDCQNYVRWIMDRAKRDPELASGIIQRAIRRAENESWPAEWPSLSYLEQAYNWLLISEVRHRDAGLGHEAPMEDLNTRPSQGDNPSTGASADWLSGLLPTALSTPGTDWAAEWSEEHARRWLSQDPIGRFVVELVDSSQVAVPRSIAKEGRAPYVAVVVTCVARASLRLGIERRESLTALLRAGLPGAVGRNPKDSSFNSRRIARCLPAAVRLVEAVLDGPAADWA